LGTRKKQKLQKERMVSDMINCIEAVGVCIGGLGLLSQVVPYVPDDLKSWPVTSMCVLIAITAMCLKTFETVKQAKAIEKMADRIGDVVTGIAVSAEQEEERSKAVDETNSKLGLLVTQMSTSNAQQAALKDELQRRPCIMTK